MQSGLQLWAHDPQGWIPTHLPQVAPYREERGLCLLLPLHLRIPVPEDAVPPLVVHTCVLTVLQGVLQKGLLLCAYLQKQRF